MTDVTIKALASEIQTSVDRLIQQFADAGIRKSADDSGDLARETNFVDAP